MFMTTGISAKSAVEIGEFIINLAVNAGSLSQKCSALDNAVEINPEKKSLPERLLNIFDAVQLQKKQYEEMIRQINTLQDIVAPVFNKQAEIIARSIDNSEAVSFQIFGKTFHPQGAKLERQFKKVIDTFNAYRKTPSEESLAEIKKEGTILQNNVQNFRSLAQRFIRQYEDPDPQNYETISDRIDRLMRLVEFQSPGQLGNLYTRLKSVCESGEPIDAEIKKGLQQDFDEFIGSFSSEMQNQFDEMIYKLAPHPKEGDLWGKLHRYDDLERFRQVLATIIQNDVEKVLIRNDQDPEVFYQVLHEQAFGPDHENPIAWAKGELPSTIELVNSVIEKMLAQKYYQDYSDEDSDTAYNDLHQVVTQSGPPSLTNAQLFEILNQWETKSVFSNTAQIIPPMRMLEQLKEKLQEIASESLFKVDKKAVKKAIQENLPDDLCSSLYEHIYYIAEDKQPGDDGWGETHCADDMDRLVLAIHNLQQSIAYQDQLEI
jgi:hypothetical protein